MRKSSIAAMVSMSGSGTPANGAHSRVSTGKRRASRFIASTTRDAAATCAVNSAASDRVLTTAMTQRANSSSIPSGGFGPTASSSRRAGPTPS